MDGEDEGESARIDIKDRRMPYLAHPSIELADSGYFLGRSSSSNSQSSTVVVLSSRIMGS